MSRDRYERVGEVLRRLRKLLDPCRVCRGRGIRGWRWFSMPCESCAGTGRGSAA